MPLSWNEIRSRAIKFSKKWEGETRERAEKQSFWNDFFEVFGISRMRVASFENPVKNLKKNTGFVDLFWKGTLIVEHKSTGKSLDVAYTQATDYFHGIQEHELPKYVLVSDFATFRLHSLEERKVHEFGISELYENIYHFGFMTNTENKYFSKPDPVNIKAAELMGELHDILSDNGYKGHELEVFLVRLLFCLFADDTGIFENGAFRNYLEVKTNVDGSNLGSSLAEVFQVLNTQEEKRFRNLDEHLKKFRYIDGSLFEEKLSITSFDSKMRAMLLKSCSLNWGGISPAIFGSMFQSVMYKEYRRSLGAHYTSEENILKIIKPLFLDDLYDEFAKIKNNKNKLKYFHDKLGKLKFLDPACGCGNFLVITYRELRLLELKVLKQVYGNQQITDIAHILKVDVDQFFGIECEEFPVRIAEVALWLIDHQMNLLVSKEFGLYYERLPLEKSATIHHGNALRVNWEEIVPKEELNYILGNPPYRGKQYQSAEQKEDVKIVFTGVMNIGVLDYVTAWFLKAARYIQNTNIKVAYVATNSIAQGEQAGILWNELFNRYNIKIHFSHRTFKWSNEAKLNASVHVVIIGFGNYDVIDKYLWYYEDINSEPIEIKVRNINPYLVDGFDTVIFKRQIPLCEVSRISFGSMPNDGGHFLLTPQERNELISVEPKADEVIKPFLCSHEYLNGKKRYCIWLKDVSPKLINELKTIQGRIQKVILHRKNSKRNNTQKLAAYPSLFGEIRQPKNCFILLPRASSGKRIYTPIGFFTPDNIVSDTCLAIDSATLYEFGVLQSVMHMTWFKYVCGRIKSDHRYSSEIVYNNFPWPKNPSEKHVQEVEIKSQQILEVRNAFLDDSLSVLYDPVTMPPKLLKAHKELDKAVDMCYRPTVFLDDMARIEYLFDLYNEYSLPLIKTAKKSKRKTGK